MKKKELKNLAKKIAECELIIQNKDSDPYDKEEARNQIFKLTGQIRDFSDLDLIDEMVQEILNKES